MKLVLEFTKIKGPGGRYPLDGSDPDETYPICGYLVVSDLGSVHQMSYRKAFRSFYFAGAQHILVDMNLVIAWAPLPDLQELTYNGKKT